MPLQNYQYDTIMREYSKTQSQNRRILEERTQEIYKKIPRIHEIDEEVATLSAKKARALLSGESSVLRTLKLQSLFCPRSAMPCWYVTHIRKIIWNFHISVRSVRIPVTSEAKNAPVLRKQR